MSRLSPHDTPGFYAGNKLYRDCLVGALRYFGMTEFSEGEEFWTLGGMEWHEFHYLVENGIVFNLGTYHNIDRGRLVENIDGRVVGHSGVEFLDIFRLWSLPRVLCFDCTEGLKECNESGWIDLVDLAIAGVGVSGRLCLNWNYMTGYGNLRFVGWDELFKLYGRWLSILLGRAEVAGCEVVFYNVGILAPKEFSMTRMLSGHCLITS